MLGSNEGNEGNEGNAGSLGRAAGSGLAVLPDRVDLPFIAQGKVADRRLDPELWPDRFWSGEWAAWLTLGAFASQVTLLTARPAQPTVTISKWNGNAGTGTCQPAGTGTTPSWQIGIYTLKCEAVTTNPVASTFVLTDPRGGLLETISVQENTTVAVQAGVDCTITNGSGNAAFKKGDGFDIVVAAGPASLWLDAPLMLQALPVKMAATSTFALPDGKGTCRADRRKQPRLGVRVGTYTLTCTDGASLAKFQLTAPGGATVTFSDVENTPNAKPTLTGDIVLELKVGAKAFEANDTFDIKVSPIKNDIFQKWGGNAGKGTCKFNPTVIAAGTPVSVHVLRCTSANANQATFELFDPDGVAVSTTPAGITLTSASPTSTVTSPVGLTIQAKFTPAGARFQQGDAFIIDVGGFDEAELLDLIRAAEDERADALGEIIAQADSFIAYFMAAMAISPRTHPKTCLLLHIGSLVGAYVSLHFKNVYARRRPSQRAPGLMPPIPMPGHPSYPSGHSTQAHLMALCVKEALPPGVRRDLGNVIDELADRIARNREIAGLHFESDSTAGANLAQSTLAALKANVPNFAAIATAAQAGEWP